MSSLEDQIRNIEAKLIEQEHRPIHVISNYVLRKKKWGKNDERYYSAKKALIWRLFFSPATLATSGGIIAILTLIILLHQNSLFTDQNKLIKNQNRFFQEQILLNEISRDITIMNSPDLTQEYKMQVISEYILNKKRLHHIRGNNKPRITGLNLSNLEFKNLDSVFNDVEFVDVRLTNTSFRNCNLSNVNFTNAIFNDTTLLNESGEFIHSKFINCDLKGSSFGPHDLTGFVFAYSNLSNINWSQAYTFYTIFYNNEGFNLGDDSLFGNDPDEESINHIKNWADQAILLPVEREKLAYEAFHQKLKLANNSESKAQIFVKKRLIVEYFKHVKKSYENFSLGVY